MAPCMSSILALSVSDKIDQYGAYAGFASVLGLAVLSLLYFAQAREVKRLREWAGRSPERSAELQERATAAAQQRAIVQPPRPATPVTPPVAPGARPAAATPAGQAQGAPGVAPAAAAAATAAGAATATPDAPTPAPGTPVAPAGQPTTAMPAANGAAAPAARPGQPLRVPGGPGTPLPPPSSRVPEPEDEGRSRVAVFGAIGAIVVVAIVAVVLLTGVLGGDDTQTQTPNPIGTPSETTADSGKTKTTTGKAATPTAAPAPGSYTVAVLNGTTVPGLARGVANRLQNTKFKIGNVTNAATQDRSATLVEFAQGHRAEADAVAKAIDVGRDAIQQLSPGSKTIAGDQATVVVTVGSDQNTSPQTPTTP